MGKRRRSSSSESSSSSSSSSEEEDKRVSNSSSSTSSSSDEDEEWNQRSKASNKPKKGNNNAKGRGRPSKKVARQEVRQSDSDSDDEDDDDDDKNSDDSGREKKTTLASSTTVSKRSVRSRNDKEEGEVDDDDDDSGNNIGENHNDDDEDEFNDGYDENLMGDEEDQQRLALMTEKEREQELFNRSEKREVLKTRFEIEKKLRLAKKKEQGHGNKQQIQQQQQQQQSLQQQSALAQAAVFAESRTTDRRKALESNRKIKDGIKALKEQREKRKQKAQKLRASDVYSSDSSSSDEEDKKRKSSSSSSSASSSSDESDSEHRRRSGDEEESHHQEKDETPFLFDLAALNSIRLSRFKMAQWCHSPFFKDTVQGCFVRLSIGMNKEKKPVYRVGEIVDVFNGKTSYELEKTKTDKMIKVKFGRDETNFRIQYVSNTEFQQSELDQWKAKLERDRINTPSRETVEQKRKDIHTAINYSYKESDIEAIVREKERFKESPVNFAMRKTHLMKQKDMAEQLGNNVEVERLNQLLDELEEKAKELDQKRTQNLTAISYINERNRLRNIVEAERAIMEAREYEKLNKGDEPFKRRKCAPMLVSMVKKEQMANEESSNATTTHKNGGQSLKESIKDNLKLPGGSPNGDDHHNDLFSAHNFDIHIDFDIGVGMSTPNHSLNSSAIYAASTPGLNSSGTARAPNNRRSLNLEEYKKKKGLI